MVLICEIFKPEPARLNPNFDFSTMDHIPIPPPKISDKLYTNYIPSVSETTKIKEYINIVNEKLFDYDARIAELNRALVETTRKRSQLAEVGMAHAALLSPFRRIPPDILQLIFVFCLPSRRNAVMHVSEAPVLLGRICSEWRRLSLATPEVWSSLHIVPPGMNCTNSAAARFQNKRESIQMWLARSGACPLRVSFVWFAGDTEDETKLCGSLLEVLVPECHRWRTLDFQVPLTMFKPFTGLTVSDVPLLEGMSLIDNKIHLDSDVVDNWPEALNFVQTSARLHTFTLAFFGGGMRLPSIPWSQLTALYLESNAAFFFVDSSEMLNTLSNCACLHTCTLKFPLYIIASLPAYQQLDMPITLPQLEVLCLDGNPFLHNTFHMSTILMNLTAPKLRKLDILGRSKQAAWGVAPEPLVALRTLLARSEPPLERLNIESIIILPELFIACLRLAPKLIELAVHNWSLRTPFDPELFNSAVGEGEQQSSPSLSNQSTGQGGPPPDKPENLILKALTLKRVVKQDKSFIPAEKGMVQLQEAAAIQTLTEPDIAATQSSPSTLSEVLDEEEAQLCPALQRFQFTLCDASQMLFCDFIASRWEDVPDGVTKIRSVRCDLNSFEEEAAVKRMDRFRSEGLAAFVSHRVLVIDELNPSPWTGLEGSL